MPKLTGVVETLQLCSKAQAFWQARQPNQTRGYWILATQPIHDSRLPAVRRHRLCLPGPQFGNPRHPKFRAAATGPAHQRIGRDERHRNLRQLLGADRENCAPRVELRSRRHKRPHGATAIETPDSDWPPPGHDRGHHTVRGRPYTDPVRGRSAHPRAHPPERWSMCCPRTDAATAAPGSGPQGPCGPRADHHATPSTPPRSGTTFYLPPARSSVWAGQAKPAGGPYQATLPGHDVQYALAESRSISPLPMP